MSVVRGGFFNDTATGGCFLATGRGSHIARGGVDTRRDPPRRCDTTTTTFTTPPSKIKNKKKKL